ncbi:sel1 repeat family protein [Aquipseudomonas alcaligenes]|uniref:Sel1 repeat family protein n=1 Tax=Aquipseudomonas alcaligenes TaxID=43263 RepID=A0A5C7W1X5_AQUAC|nr:sel1 repeat family protein [Pseudomonas alcaligenes]MDH1056826.1 sel1 repeat family protein [Pseudomonas alcaligenes]TXI31299.1 MAG: sel1 repeat family protein [Pseudomonas alcaligenes]
MVTRNLAASSLAAIFLCMAAMMGGNAQAATCPADNFHDFATAFQNQPDIQIAHVGQPLILRRVEIESDRAVVRSEETLNPDHALQDVLALQKSPRLTVTVKSPDRIILRDKNGESLVILVFEQENCWTLDRIEDWSLAQQLPSTRIADPAAVAVERGNLYNNLAGNTPSNSRIELYVSALDSYLYGASLGSAEAAYAAAGISLSGRAPRLPNQQMQSLLEAAARTIPEAGITLAYFYCDEGHSGTDDPCANPEKALQALKDIAQLSPKTALVELGNAYASDDIVIPDTSRALACYLEAQSKGATGLESAIAELKSQGAAVHSSIHCL